MGMHTKIKKQNQNILVLVFIDYSACQTVFISDVVFTSDLNPEWYFGFLFFTFSSK